MWWEKHIFFPIFSYIFLYFSYIFPIFPKQVGRQAARQPGSRNSTCNWSSRGWLPLQYVALAIGKYRKIYENILLFVWLLMYFCCNFDVFLMYFHLMLMLFLSNFQVCFENPGFCFENPGFCFKCARFCFENTSPSTPTLTWIIKNHGSRWQKIAKHKLFIISPASATILAGFACLLCYAVSCHWFVKLWIFWSTDKHFVIPIPRPS